MPRTNAFAFLTASEPHQAHAVTAVVGNDGTLRRWVIESLVGQADWTQFDGTTAAWSDLSDDLSTASLFDMGTDETRVLAVRSGDPFVSSHRAKLEEYLASPGTTCRLVLELDSLPGNTRLAKAIDKHFQWVHCSGSIESKAGVTAASRRKFLTQYVASRHQTKLTKEAADTLVEMLGDDVGMLDTEVAKLAVYLPIGGTIDGELVRDVVAGWQGKTIWQITDAIVQGDAAEALLQLDHLLDGGQHALALLPQIAWSLRRYGMATAAFLRSERHPPKLSLDDALASAGVRPFELQSAKKAMKSLGRDRAQELLPWLLDSDLRLKGTHSNEGRDRFQLEQLVLRMARRETSTVNV
ncbi:MAG: DNA polymerase III subunit delta [Planctomycetota bacterium]